MQDLNLVDQTRGILTWVTDNVPGNFHQEIGYATVRPGITACIKATCRIVGVLAAKP